MLTDRQKLTIQHLEEKGIVNTSDIIEWCVESMKKGRASGKRRKAIREGRTHKKGNRNHSLKYYQEIMDHLNKLL